MKFSVPSTCYVLIFSYFFRGRLLLEVAETPVPFGRCTAPCYIHIIITRTFRWLHDEC